jgi:MarR family transcriptional regulator, transcriptional regulator for hemolysin
MSDVGLAEGTGEIRRDIALRLGVLARMLRNGFDRQVASLGVTRSQWTMIVVVARNPGATQRVIAEALEMSEASAGRLIDRLCAEGLLERQERFDDRRARAVYLTKAAEPLLEKLYEVGLAAEKRLFRGFAEDELEAMKGFLDRLYKNAG